MAFQIRSSLNAGTMTDNWSSGVSGAGQKLLKGYSNPRRDPQANPGAAAASWQAGVSNAVGKYQHGISSYDSAAAIASMQANGVSRYTSAATNKKQKFNNFATAYAQTIAQGMASLPTDRSSYAARQARSRAMQDYLHANPYKKS